MLKLKTVSLLGHRSELDALPKGKLLINTINAHSYNTALKDSLFMECAEGEKGTDGEHNNNPISQHSGGSTGK